MNLHIDLIRGENSHHSSEAIFKAFARALDRGLVNKPKSSGRPVYQGDSAVSTEVKYDCRYFKGDVPCKFNKLDGSVCECCEHYDKVEGKILMIKLGRGRRRYKDHPSFEKTQTCLSKIPHNVAHMLSRIRSGHSGLRIYVRFSKHPVSPAGAL